MPRQEEKKFGVIVEFTAKEKQQIRTAAAMQGMSMAAFLKREGLAEAEKILEKSFQKFKSLSG